MAGDSVRMRMKEEDGGNFFGEVSLEVFVNAGASRQILSFSSIFQEFVYAGIFEGGEVAGLS